MEILWYIFIISEKALDYLLLLLLF